jgi:hypothetical protein
MPGHSYTRTEPTTPPRKSVPFLIGYLRALSYYDEHLNWQPRTEGLTDEDREILEQVIAELETLRYRDVNTPQSALPTHNEGSFA